MSAQTLDITVERTKEIVSYDPATGEEVGRVPLAAAEEVKEAVKRARLAPGEAAPLVGTWKSGKPVRIDYGAGALALPSP